MYINLSNRKILFLKKANCQTNLQNCCLSSVNNDMYTRMDIPFTGLNSKNKNKLFEKFEIDEYKKLTSEEIIALRNSLTDELIQDRDAIITLSNAVKTNLNKEYPNGYVFVSIGQSSAAIGQALECQGVDVRYCPISDLRNMSENKFNDELSQMQKNKILKYKDYLKSINLSNKKIQNDSRKYIFADYTSSGVSLRRFKALLGSPKININSSNAIFKSLNKDIILKTHNEMELPELKKLVYTYLSAFKIKRYSPYKRLNFSEIDKIYDIKKRESSKIMQFALFDYFNKEGMLKKPLSKNTHNTNLLDFFLKYAKIFKAV